MDQILTNPIVQYLLNTPTGNFVLLMLATGIPAVFAHIVFQPRSR